MLTAKYHPSFVVNAPAATRRNQYYKTLSSRTQKTWRAGGITLRVRTAEKGDVRMKFSLFDSFLIPFFPLFLLHFMLFAIFNWRRPNSFVLLVFYWHRTRMQVWDSR